MPINPNETLEKHIDQTGVTTGTRRLELIKRALSLRGTPPIRAQERTADPIAYVRLFDPAGAWTWLITEWNQEDCEAFGLALGHEREFGYVDLRELSGVAGPLGIGVEIDVFFVPQPLSQALKGEAEQL